MVTHHYWNLPCWIDWHDIVDDFGNVVKLSTLKSATWARAYLFANNQTFEQAGMHSIDVHVSMH